MSGEVRILCVDDSEKDVEQIRGLLGADHPLLILHRVATRDELIACLRSRWNLVLSEYEAAGMRFTEVLASIRARHSELPVILWSGAVDRMPAVEVLALDASDVLLKSNPSRLAVVLRRVLREQTERRRRAAAEVALNESERICQLFVEHAPAPLAMFDRNMVYLAVSRRWITEYQLESQIVLGRSHYDVFPEIPERWKAIHRRGLSGEIISCDEDSFERANGRIIALKWEVRPWFLDDGSIGGLVVTSADISAQVEAREAIRASEARFRLMMEQAADGIVLADARGCFVDANAAALAMFGRGQEEFLRLGVDDVVALEAMPMANGLSSPFNQGTSTVSEWLFRRRDGSTFLGEVAVRELEEGIYQATIRDITPRREAESQRLQAAELQRDMLVREVHHRIKNHLQGVIGLFDNSASQHPEIAGPISAAIERIRAIAHVYGLLSRRDDSSVPLHELLERVIEGATTSVVPVRFQHSVLKSELILRQSESVPMALIVNELVSNALKHLIVPDPSRPVQVHLTDCDDHAHIEVRAGPARLPTPFDFEQRVGTGMGLELVGALMPVRGAKLRIAQVGDEVVARLLVHQRQVMQGAHRTFR